MTTRQTSRARNTADRQPGLDIRWQRLGIRRASEQARLATISTGWRAFDALLPGGGYPLAAVTELLLSDIGIGEFSLVLTCLAARLTARPQHRIALVSPPCRLNASALATAGVPLDRAPVIHCRDDNERLWCVEQMARAQAFAAFVVWSDDLNYKALRRLQLAAEQAACPVFVYRPLKHARQRSPAALRLAITQYDGRQQLEVRKCRGPSGARLAGLCAIRDRPWQMPAFILDDFTNRSACNDTACNPMVRPGVSPLGTR